LLFDAYNIEGDGVSDWFAIKNLHQASVCEIAEDML
jgi:hypothetical protein